MFGSDYYCLVAGLREYALDADTKGFDARAIVAEILDGVSARDAKQVRLLYGYYDCENLAALRAGRAAHNPLGLLTREELAAELKSPKRLPEAVARVVRAYADPEGEDAEQVDTAQRFERALFGAYYAACERAGGDFLRAWSEFDRTLRNIAAAVSARAAGRNVGLRGELPYIDAVIAAVNEEANLVEKERKIDRIRWREAEELAAFDYFDIDAILSYLVRVNVVARWSRLDPAHGREMFARLVEALDGRKLIENKQ